jgi:hypothetical protein
MDHYRQIRSAVIAQSNKIYRKFKMSSVIHYDTSSCATDYAMCITEVLVIIAAVLEFSRIVCLGTRMPLWVRASAEPPSAEPLLSAIRAVLLVRHERCAWTYLAITVYALLNTPGPSPFDCWAAERWPFWCCAPRPPPARPRDPASLAGLALADPWTFLASCLSSSLTTSDLR